MYLLMRAFVHIFKVKNPYVLAVWQKAVLLSFVIPFLFIFFFQKHVRWYESIVLIEGVFWESEIDNGICIAIEIFWLCGFLIALARTLFRQRQMKKIWLENEAADDTEWPEMFEEYKKRFCLPNVRLYRNPLLMSPVSACRRCPMIVLPDREYSPKELHMILTHEMNHIRHRDLLWRKAAIVAGWVNWYLPLSRLLQKELVYQQEMICDLCSSTGNPAFSQREYGRFLVSLTDNEWGNVSVTALCESENIIIRRLEVMKQAKDMTRPKRWIVAATCAGLAVLTLIPSGFVQQVFLLLYGSWFCQ